LATTKEQRRKWGHYPAQDVDVSTAFELLEWSWYRFARSTEALEANVVRAVLQDLEPWSHTVTKSARDGERRKAASVFLRVAVDDTTDEALLATWRTAVNALKVFESQYAWGSKEKAAKLMELRKNERLVEAARAAAVGSTVVPLELLAVLALEGSEMSADAMLPHVERALKDEAQLEPLSRLSRYAAKTKAMTSLMALIDGRLNAARTSAPANDLAKALGIASGNRFRVEVRVAGTGNRFFWISIDSDRPGPAFCGGVGGERTSTQLHHEDGSTECSLVELPAYLRQAAKKLDTTWEFRNASTRHLRGKRLATFLAWLEGTGSHLSEA
jgi:hypothetical protein